MVKREMRRYRELVTMLERARGAMKRTLLWDGLLRASLVFLPLLLILFLVDNLFHLGSALRIAGILLCLFAPLSVFGKRLWIFFSPLSLESVAVRLERAFPQLDNQLINAVQLGRMQESPLVLELVREAFDSSRSLSISHAAGREEVKKRTILLVPLIALAGIYLLLMPEGFLNAANRYLHPMSSISPFSQTHLKVLPGDAVMVRGSDLDVIARTSGVMVQNAVLEMRENKKTSRLEMKFDGTKFFCKQENILTPFEYRVLAGDAETRWFRIRVIEKPGVKEFTLSLEFPSYTKIPNRTVQDSSGDIRAVAGTDLDLTIASTKPLKKALAVLSNGDEIPFTLSGPSMITASLSLHLTESGNYRVHLLDNEGYDNQPSPLYTINVAKDTPPVIAIASPGVELELEPSRTLPVLYRVADDFGVSSLAPQISLEQGGEFRSLPTISFQPSVREREDGYPLDLSDGKPGETVWFRFLARDNCPSPGPGETVSRVISIHIREAKEISKKSLDPDTAKKLEELRKKTEEFKEVQKKAIQATRELLEKDPDKWTPGDSLKAAELAALEDNWARFFEDAHSDLSKLPKLVSSDTELIQDTLEVYQEVKKIPDHLIPKPVTISVTEEQTGLELAEELTAHLEKWLPDTPDYKKWEMEEPSEDYDIPLADLPDELEDIIGELIEQEEDFTDEIEDVSSSWGDSLDKGAGWEAADGPISNYSAQGVTGNILPNSSEIGGRSGEGRSGRSHGEFVEASARGKGGRKTPTRLTDDPFETGEVRDEMKEMTSGSTGGGKLSGAGGEGLRGPPPPPVREAMDRLSGKQANLITRAEKLKIAFESRHLPTRNIDRAIQGMQNVERDLRQYRYQNVMPEQQIILQNLKAGKLLGSRKVHFMRENENGLKKSWKTNLSQGMKESFPKGYEKIVESYYKRLARH